LEERLGPLEADPDPVVAAAVIAEAKASGLAHPLAEPEDPLYG
jgi:hypothetical protein